MNDLTRSWCCVRALLLMATAIALLSLVACSQDGDDVQADLDPSPTDETDPGDETDLGVDATDDNGGDSDAQSDGSSESESSGERADAGTDEDQPQQEDHDFSGAFRIQLVAPVEATDSVNATPGYVSVLGRVYEYEPPIRTGWELLEEQAGCELLEPVLPFCDPACEGGEVCAVGDMCMANPAPLDLGTVMLTGLATESGQAIEMTPLPPSNTYQPPSGTAVEYLPFGPGDAIQLHAEGNLELGVTAFTIQGYAVGQLVVDTAASPRFAPNEDAEITWDPPGADDVSTVELIVDISHHGGQKGELRCEVDDTGSFTIPASLVTGLIELGVAGFPEVRIVRQTVAYADEALGSIELRVESARVVYLDIPGVDSCANIGSTEECDDGKVCQQDLQCGAGP